MLEGVLRLGLDIVEEDSHVGGTVAARTPKSGRLTCHLRHGV